MRTDNMNTTIMELQPKQRQTRRQSDINSWYRVRISTSNFVELMGFRYKIEGETTLKVWVSTALFPHNVVPVTLNKAKDKRTAKQHGAKLDAPRMDTIPPTGDSGESPIFDLPLFLPVPLPPRVPTELPKPAPILDMLDFEEREDEPPMNPVIDLTSEDSSKLKTGSSRYHIFPPVIDLTVEDSSVHAESSAMAAQRGNRRGTYSDGNSDIIYISD